MGCDIHTFAFRKSDENWYLVRKDALIGDPYPDEEFFGYRNYGMFAFLSGGAVRNYSKLTTTLQPSHNDKTLALIESHADANFFGAHTPCMLTIEQLTQFDYDQIMVDKRNNDTVQTYREFLGTTFFKHLDEMVRKGVTHLLFYFDN